MVSFCTAGKLRRLSLRHQHFVQRLVHGIEHWSQRELDGAAAFGLRVTRREADVREITRARLVERRAGDRSTSSDLCAQSRDSTPVLRARIRR